MSGKRGGLGRSTGLSRGESKDTRGRGESKDPRGRGERKDSSKSLSESTRLGRAGGVGRGRETPKIAAEEGLEERSDRRYEQLKEFVNQRIGRFIEYLKSIGSTGDFTNLKYENPEYVAWLREKPSAESLKELIEGLEAKIASLNESKNGLIQEIKRILFDESKRTFDEGQITFSEPVIEQVDRLHRLLASNVSEIFDLEQNIVRKKALLGVNISDEDKADELYPSFLKTLLITVVNEDVDPGFWENVEAMENVLVKCLDLYNKWILIDRLYRMFSANKKYMLEIRSYKNVGKTIPPPNDLSKLDEEGRIRKRSELMNWIDEAFISLKVMIDHVNAVQAVVLSKIGSNDLAENSNFALVQNHLPHDRHHHHRSGHNKCGVFRCNAPAHNVCGACERAFYCSRRHQREDWDSHKRFCVKM